MSLTDHAQEVKHQAGESTSDKWEGHPIAAIFPLMSDSELAELAKDINEHGQREDIVVYQGKILDGRNRYRACLLADVEPRVTSYIGTDPIRDVLSWNLHRRHLNVSQRAAIATAALPLLEKQARERKAEAARKLNAALKGNPIRANLPGPDKGQEEHRARTDAATMFSVSPRSVQTAKKIQQEAPELLEEVKSGNMTLNAADQQVKQAKRKRKEDARPVHDFRVLAIRPDWNLEYKTLRRLEFPDTEECFHTFVVVPNERMNDGLYLFRDWFGVPPSCMFTVRREAVVKVDGVSTDTDIVFYAPIGAPEWVNGGPQSTRETGDLSEFWQKVESWTDGPRVSVGFEAEGFKCLPL